MMHLDVFDISQMTIIEILEGDNMKEKPKTVNNERFGWQPEETVQSNLSAHQIWSIKYAEKQKTASALFT